MTNILILSAPSPKIGAGVVGISILNALRSRGHSVRLLVNTQGENVDPDVKGINDIKQRIYTRLRNVRFFSSPIIWAQGRYPNIDPKYHIQDYVQTQIITPAKHILKYVQNRPDVIIVTFAQKFIDVKTLYKLKTITGAKVFWYMMDSAAITGGCHYFWDCTGYMDACEFCPALISDQKINQIHENFKHKRYYFQKMDITFIVPTTWQYNKVIASKINSKNRIKKLLLPLGNEHFRYTATKLARSKLGVITEKKVIFVGAYNLNDKRKGIKYAVESINLIADELPLLILMAGKNHLKYIKSLKCEYIYCGVINKESELALVFQSSDIFLCPSIEDSGPMMINQSIACGTPVVSFDQGVALDLVLNGKTGYSSGKYDVHTMSNNILDILSCEKERYDNMVDNCLKLSNNINDNDQIGKRLEEIIHGE